jgi:nucleotide-binding universal stress UspA family protein
VLTVRGTPVLEQQMVSRILVPVDYSDGSANALGYARELAKALKASIDVVHVWDRPSFVPDKTLVQMEGGVKRSLGDLIRDNAEREMEAFLRAHPIAGEATPGHRLLSGEPASTLLHELEQGQHQLVVVGTRGLSGFRHLLLGSVAEKLVRFSPVPVLTVPPR